MTTLETLRERKVAARIKVLYAQCWGTQEERDEAWADLEEILCEQADAGR